MNHTTDDLRAWIGRSETVHDTVTPTPVAALTATLDHPATSTGPGTVLPPLVIAGIVLIFVVFMLLQREDLRDRLLGVVGHGHLARTTKALDEAGSRVSRRTAFATISSDSRAAICSVSRLPSKKARLIRCAPLSLNPGSKCGWNSRSRRISGRSFATMKYQRRSRS